MADTEDRRERRRRRRRRFRLVVLLTALPFLAEISAYAAGRVLQSKWCMYVDPLEVSPTRIARDYDHYLELRDPELGWPFPTEFGGEGHYTAEGAIAVPANEGLPESPHVSLYGDSFTWGLTNQTHEEAWANRLALKLGKRVENFGVGGYGSDQAYLRFLRQTDDHAESVVLGHMSENMTRNLTRLRDLTAGGGQGFSFKPRFDLDAEGHLEAVPLLDLNQEDYLRFLGVRAPQLFVPHENFYPGGPMGVVRLTFPYTLAVLRNFGYWRFQARLARRPEYEPFYDPEHFAHGLQITAAILTSFVEVARQRGQRPLVLLFPGREDLALRQQTGVSMLAGLAERVRASGVTVIDFTELLADYLGDRPAEAIYANHHFTTEVDPLVADAVAQALTTE